MALPTSIRYCRICSNECPIRLNNPSVVCEVSSPVTEIKWARLSRLMKRLSSTQIIAGGSDKVIPFQGSPVQIRSSHSRRSTTPGNTSTCPPDFTVEDGNSMCPLESPVRSGPIGCSPNNAGRGDAGIAHSPELLFGVTAETHTLQGH